MWYFEFIYHIISGHPLGREPGGDVDAGGAERRPLRGGAQEVEPLAARHHRAAQGGGAHAGTDRRAPAAPAAKEGREDQAQREKGTVRLL